MGELGNLVRLAPCRKPSRSIQVRLASVIVIHLAGEEFHYALSGLGRGRKERCGDVAGSRGQDQTGGS